MQIIIPIVLFAVMGLVAGILLTAASSFFAVETDPRQEKITETLPGANCGGCGFAGCADYAEAVVKGNAEPNLCRPGGPETAQKIGEILGKTVEAAEPEVMTVHCSGDCKSAKALFDYAGMESCAAAKAFYGGNGQCSFGCLGLGDCVKVCEEKAICIQDGLARVIPERCLACGRCAAVCPNGLFSLRPKSNPVAVGCSSADNGKATRLACDKGCIGCKLCEKKCPEGAVKVENFHASIDYSKCTGCGTCAQACPAKVIHTA